MGDGRDVLRDRVVERWALGGRYGGVGRSLHVGGVGRENVQLVCFHYIIKWKNRPKRSVKSDTNWVSSCM